jgi:predicted transposase YbfD/YdcC
MTYNSQILNQNSKLSNSIPSLYNYLLDVVDFRNVNHPRFKHKLADCLMIMILAMMSNFNSQRSMEDFAQNYFEYFIGVFGCGGVLPNHSLFNRVCIKLDFESLGKSLFTWVLDLAKFFGLDNQLLNFQIDGKALCGTIEKNKVFDHSQNFTQIVSLFNSNLGIVIDNISMESKKTSEAFKFRDLANKYSGLLDSKTLSGDALHCSQETIQLLANLNINYILGVKGNSKLFLQTLLNQVESGELKLVGKHTQTSKDKKFKREISIYKIPLEFKIDKKYKSKLYTFKTKDKISKRGKHKGELIKGKFKTQLNTQSYKGWNNEKQNLNLKTFAIVNTTNLRSQKTTPNYYISNLDPLAITNTNSNSNSNTNSNTNSNSNNAKKIQEYIQAQWAIENSLHWEKDMVFQEDKHKTKHNNSAKIHSQIITLAINIFRLHQSHQSSHISKPTTTQIKKSTKLSMKKTTQKYCNQVAQCLKMTGFVFNEL